MEFPERPDRSERATGARGVAFEHIYPFLASRGRQNDGIVMELFGILFSTAGQRFANQFQIPAHIVGTGYGQPSTSKSSTRL